MQMSDFLYASESNVPTEPGLYGVVFGGGDENIGDYLNSEAVLLDKNGLAWVFGAETRIDLNKSPYNHIHTRYTKRIKIRVGKPEHYGE